MAPKWSDNLTGSQRPFLGIPVRTQGLQGRAQWCHILSQNFRRHWVHGTPKFSVQLEKLDANWTTLRLSIDSLWSRISYRTHSYRWATGDQWYDPVTRWLTEKKKSWYCIANTLKNIKTSHPGQVLESVDASNNPVLPRHLVSYLITVTANDMIRSEGAVGCLEHIELDKIGIKNIKKDVEQTLIG